MLYFVWNVKYGIKSMNIQLWNQMGLIKLILKVEDNVTHVEDIKDQKSGMIPPGWNVKGVQCRMLHVRMKKGGCSR